MDPKVTVLGRVARGAVLLAGVAVLAGLVARMGPATIIEMLRTIRWGFPVVVALYAAHLAVRALALWLSLPAGRPRYVDVLRVRLSSEAIETLTFTGPLLAEPTKGYLLTRYGVEVAQAFGATATEYLLYTVVSSWLAGAALSLLLARGMLPVAVTAAVKGLIVAAGLFTVGVAFAALSRVGLFALTARGMGRFWGQRRADAIVSRIEPVERVVIDFLHRRPSRLGAVLAVEAVGHALLVLEIWVVLSALGLRASLAEPFLIEGGGKFISIAFAFVPGQIGAAEGVYALLFRALGLPAAAGLTLSLVRRARAFIVAGVGAGVLGWMDRGPRL